MNATTIYVVTTTADITSPSYSGEATETPYYVGRAIAFTITVDDAVALQDSGQYIFSTDNSGTWVNDTAVNFKTTSEVARNVTTLNSTVGKVVSYRWFFSDNVGNTNSTPVYNLTTIYYPGTNNDNGATGGSGGSSTSSPTTYTVDAQFSSGAGNEYNLKVSDKISFPVSSVSHSLTLNKFNSTTAKVTIQSTPIITTLQKGVLYEVDTNGDSVSDVRIRYDGLVGGKAAIFIQEIPVPVVTNPTGEVANNNPSETAGNTNTNTNEGATNTTPVTSNSSKLKWGIIIIAIVIIAIVLIMMLVARKKDKKKRYYSFGY
jgi:phenolic acid decarboxylase